MAQANVEDEGRQGVDQSGRRIDPLEDAWRYALRCRPLLAQFVGCGVALVLAGLGWGVARGLSSGAGQIVCFSLGLILAYMVSVATSAVVMASASAAEAEDESFRAGSFVLRSLVPCVVVTGSCIAAVVLVSIFFHSVLILLASTGRVLGEIIFALALVPMYAVALLELLLLLGAMFVFPPVVVDGSPGALGSLQRFLDALIACRLSDLRLRLRALVVALLVALPIALALGVLDLYVLGMSAQAGVCPWAMASGSLLVDILVVLSGVVIAAAAFAVPMAYLNTACLMVHRAEA